MHWLSVFQAGLFVAVLVTCALIGLQQGTIRTLRGTNTDLRARRDDLEKDRADLTGELEKERKENARKIADMEGAVRVLMDSTTAKDEITVLTARLESHHEESMATLKVIADRLAPSANGG